LRNEAFVIGEIVGSYKIETKLGQGGMGVVYVAQHPLLKKKAVVKFLHAELSSDGELVDRFFNEARSATMIRHPGIVDVFDFGHHASGCAFILMEFLHGESLSDRIKKDGPFEASFAIAIGKQLASALAAAHEQGIVHRDLKPDNVFLVPDREAPGGTRVKVLDFGIAKLSNDAAVKTQAGAVMGTPTYMAPEQCRSAGEVDHRADIYALGCIMFEMVAGRPPFRAQSLGQLIAAHMFEPPLSPSAFGTPVSSDLEAVILRALEKEPDDRQGSMSNFSIELSACDGAPITAPVLPFRRSAPIVTPAALDETVAPIAPSTAPTAAALTTLGKSTGQFTDVIEKKSSRAGLWAAIGGVVVIAAGIVVWKTTASSEPVPVAAAPAPTPPAPAPVIIERPALPKPITLTLDSEPAGAEVIQEHDGMRLGKTPYDKTLAPVAGGTLVYVLRLDGYEDHRVTLAADRDNREKVALKAIKKKPPPTTTSRPRPPSTTPPSSPVPAGPTPDGMLRPKT
jgi:serine/threonine-protein kinase